MIEGQLYYGRHTAAVVSGGLTPVQYDGTGLIVSAVQYYPDPLPGVPTLNSEPSSNGSNKKAIIGGVVGGVLGLGLLVGAIIIFYRRRWSMNRGEAGNPQLDLLAAVNLSTPGSNEQGLAGAPGEKSESAVMAQAATATTTLLQSPQRDFAQAVLPAAQPYESRTVKPLPSPPPTQQASSNNPNVVEPPQHSEPQLSPQQARLVQELVDQGVPPTQVAGVVKSMLASGASSNTDATVAAPSDTPGHASDAPPQYDFKNTSAKVL
ncbi:hypothetical protein FS837_011327 [Tulasnella sp. UAMH 9824]|nr:hypothetical protein FS837_011327 [Tulasnella sp. UAMH 9824]